MLSCHRDPTMTASVGGIIGGRVKIKYAPAKEIWRQKPHGCVYIYNLTHRVSISCTFFSIYFMNQLLREFRKAKRKRILTLSAAGYGSGVQGIYLQNKSSSWDILAHAFIPYPSQVSDLISQFDYSCSPLRSPEEFAVLDKRLSEALVEGARTLMASAPKERGTSILIVLNRFLLWKGATTQSGWWQVGCGSAGALAAETELPVLTDLQAFYPSRTTPGQLPLLPGILKYATAIDGEFVVVNIGQLARLFVTHKEAMTMAVDTIAGPGTFLINRAAQDCGCEDGFDRDGSFAAKGNVNHDCLEQVITRVQGMTLNEANLSCTMQELLDLPCLTSLDPPDKLATLTAVSARCMFDTYKKNYTLDHSPTTIWLAGGGANNLTLREYLGAYFSPIKIRTIDELGIPPDAFFPMALSLSVQSWIDEEQNFWEKAGNVRPPALGTLVSI